MPAAARSVEALGLPEANDRLRVLLGNLVGQNLREKVAEKSVMNSPFAGLAIPDTVLEVVGRYKKMHYIVESIEEEEGTWLAACKAQEDLLQCTV